MNLTSLTRLIAVCATLVPALGCQSKDRMDNEGVDPTSVADVSAASTGQEHLVLSPDDLTHQQDLGLDGDAEAALKVAMHYAAQSTAVLHFREDAKYWFEVAAENGDPIAMINHAQLMYEAGGKKNCRRALFWLKRADGMVEAEDVRASLKAWQRTISSNEARLQGNCQ